MGTKGTLRSQMQCCAAIIKRYRRCKSYALHGSYYCVWHNAARVAYHEAGHALMREIKHLDHKKQIDIGPQEDHWSGQRWFIHEIDEYADLSKTKLCRELQCLLGGGAAQELAFPNDSNYVNDKDIAGELSKSIPEIDIETIRQQVKKRMQEPWACKALHALADTLLQHKTLSGSTVRGIVRNFRPYPRET